MGLNDLFLDVFQLECKLFMKMDSYRLIEQKCNEKCLNFDERQTLNSEIHYSFTRLIKTIKDACPDLTEEDIIFCCLSKTDLDASIICRCMGNNCKKSTIQRKYRIKKKMIEAGCETLFEVIFCPSLLSACPQI